MSRFKHDWAASKERWETTITGGTPDRVPLFIVSDEVFGSRISGQTVRNMLDDPKVLAKASLDTSEFLGIDVPNSAVLYYAGPMEAYTIGKVNGYKDKEIATWNDFATIFIHQGIVAETEEKIDNLIIPDHTKDGYWPTMMDANAIVKEKTGMDVGFTLSLTWSIVQELRGTQAYMDVYQNPDLLLKLCEKIYASQMDLYQAHCKKLGKPALITNAQYAFNKLMLSFEDAWQYEGQFIARFCKEVGLPLGVHNCGFEPYWDEMIDKLAEKGVQVVSVNGCRPKSLEYWVEFRRKYPEITIMGANIYVNEELAFGSPEDVEAIVKENIETLAPLKRFILSPNCSPGWGISMENILTVRDVVEKYGTFPINA